MQDADNERKRNAVDSNFKRGLVAVVRYTGWESVGGGIREEP